MSPDLRRAVRLATSAIFLLPLVAPRVRAQARGVTQVPADPLPSVTGPGSHPGSDTEPNQSTPPAANAAFESELAKLGWKAIENDALVRLDGPEKGYIPANYLQKADLEWKNGALNFGGGDAISEKQLPMILAGLWIFVQAAELSPIDAGKSIAAQGLPPVVDGRKLLDPDGSATYYGQMLRLIYAEKPDALKLAGAERLSQSLDLLAHAHDQAFKYQSADVAKTDVDRAKLMLFAPVRAGETPFDVKPYQDLGGRLSDIESELEADVTDAKTAGDANRAKDSAAALDVLDALKEQHYHQADALPEVPPPGEAPPDLDGDAGNDDWAVHGAPLASGLPRLLKVLDRVNGKPLTPDQQENLIKSFPMGDLVWRLGAQDLWRQGLTGKGVKVAVIDGGIGNHVELAQAVKARVNFTADRGRDLIDDHGTHVAGIIHAIAPDAEIRGYAIFANDGANPALQEGSDGPIFDAIDQAVKDGNRVINMSFGGGASPSDLLARKIETYKDQGIIFILASGNSHDGGIVAPSVAPNALTVGALDGAGRAADFSSYGADYDARKLRHVVKSVFMLPGTNIYSTVMGPNNASDYASMDGSSMATPALSGVTALLAQAATNMTPNPIELSARVRDALVEGSAPMSLDKLPSNAPVDQSFLVVSPLAALDALRQKTAPSTAGGPSQPRN